MESKKPTLEEIKKTNDYKKAKSYRLNSSFLSKEEDAATERMIELTETLEQARENLHYIFNNYRLRKKAKEKIKEFERRKRLRKVGNNYEIRKIK